MARDFEQVNREKTVSAELTSANSLVTKFDDTNVSVVKRRLYYI